jgi:hypothetical protein
VYGFADSCDLQLHNIAVAGDRSRSGNFNAINYHDGTACGDAGGQLANETLLRNVAGSSGINACGIGSGRRSPSAANVGNVNALRSVWAAVAATGVQRGLKLADPGERDASWYLHDHCFSDVRK